MKMNALARIRAAFFERLQPKAEWGNLEVERLYDEVCAEVLIAMLEEKGDG